MNSIFKTLITLAIPLICQNLITYSVTLADNLMIGRLGKAPISGLFMASIVQFVLQMLLFGLDGAMKVLSTQYWGRKDTDRIKTLVSMTMRGAIIISLVTSLLTYFFPTQILMLLTNSPDAVREGSVYLNTVSPSFLFSGMALLLIGAMTSVEVVVIGLITSVVALVLNVSLNYVFIFGHFGCPAMGVAGAALATDISRVVEFLVVYVFVLRFDENLKMKLSDFKRFDGVLCRDLVKYGTPLLFGQIVWIINKFSMRAIVGHFQESSLVAVSISETLDGLLWVGTVGLASAMGIVTGKMIGQGNLAHIKAYARRMQGIFASIGVISFLIVIFGRDLFISFYNIDQIPVEVPRTFLLVLAFSVLGRAYQAPCLMGLVKAGGDTSFVFKNDTFWVFCWVLPSAIIAWKMFHAPDWVVYAFLLSDQVTKCVVAYIKINRFHWMKNLTRS